MTVHSKASIRLNEAEKKYPKLFSFTFSYVISLPSIGQVERDLDFGAELSLFKLAYHGEDAHRGGIGALTHNLN